MATVAMPTATFSPSPAASYKTFPDPASLTAHFETESQPGQGNVTPVIIGMVAVSVVLIVALSLVVNSLLNANHRRRQRAAVGGGGGLGEQPILLTAKLQPAVGK
ncbi:hypothetical protein BDZ88DRAFT_509749 [Geranomyces variabilis]|nr:hypothetical protein BDZ88DRAFT_509749 [Geranomyces variabilis]